MSIWGKIIGGFAGFAFGGPLGALLGAYAARLLKIPDSGHLPFVEQPDIFYPAVEQFLNGEWPEN